MAAARSFLAAAALCIACLHHCATRKGLGVVLAGPSSIFVIGDSYADTGNHDNQQPVIDTPWHYPYGNTWGSPSGRYSDGQVLTDGIASIAGLNGPVNYKDKDSSSPDDLARGMSFAFGGSGVFPTWAPEYPTFPDQINQLQGLVNDGVYSSDGFGNALLLYVLSGNDYAYASGQDPNVDLIALAQLIIIEITSELQYLYNMGFRKFAIALLEPMGCLPTVTSQKGYSDCDGNINFFVTYHNAILQLNITSLVNSLPGFQVALLDQYSAFLNVIQSYPNYGLQEPYRPCCEPTNDDGICGLVDESGNALYNLCGDASKNFWWDLNHPSNAAWDAMKPAYSDMLQGILA